MIPDYLLTESVIPHPCLALISVEQVLYTDIDVLILVSRSPHRTALHSLNIYRSQLTYLL